MPNFMIFNYVLKASEQIDEYFLNEFNSQKIEIPALNTIRTKAFEIEAFGRVVKRAYKKSNKKKKNVRLLSEQIKLNAKYMEDSIGDYLYHWEMKDFALSEKRLDLAKKNLEGNVKSFNEKTSQIRRDFSELSREYELKKLYLKGLVREIKKINESVLSIDSELLEDGTHELRRKLRWVIMHVIYPKGLFTYKGKNLATTKYTKLSPNKNYKPIEITFEVINRLSSFVYELGKIKDLGLAENYNKPHSKINQSNLTTIELTKKIIAEVEKEKLLEILIKDL